MPKLQNNQKNMNNHEFLIIFVQKIESLTANLFSIIFCDDVINASVTYLVSSDVFIIEEQLCKSVSQLVKN